MELLLVKENLWTIVTDVVPAERNNDWTERNNKAKAIIGLSLEDNQLQHVRKLETAKGYWDALKQIHEKSSLSGKVSLLRRLCQLKMQEEGNLETHLNTFFEICDRLDEIEETLTDRLQIAMLLSSLPESFDSIIMALEARPDEDLTINLVKEKLMNESVRRQGNRSTEIKSDHAFKLSKFKRNPVTCNHCHREGHIKKDCWFLRKSEKFNKNKQRANVTVTENGDSKKDYCFSISNFEKNKWFIDSGSTCHITSNKNFFENLRTDTEEYIYTADGKSVKVEGIGNGYLNIIDSKNIERKIEISNVKFVPGINGNLISVAKLAEKGFKVLFYDNVCTISKNDLKIECYKGKNNLYPLNLKTNKKECINLVTENINIWHKRLGHKNYYDLKRLSNGLVDDIKIIDAARQECETCLKAKFSQLKFGKSTRISNEPLELIHTDICGPMSVETPSGKRYYLTMIDDFSRYCVVYLLNTKDQAKEKIIEYIETMENQLNKRAKKIRSDNAKEYISKDIEKYFVKKSIVHELSAPYTPQQNCLSERENRSLTETGKRFLFEAKMNLKYWGEAIMTANYLLNRLPTRCHDKTPFEMLYGDKLKLGHIKTFGCTSFMLIPKQNRKKLDEKSLKLKLVGYCETSKAYRLLDIETDRIYISRDVRFIENNNEPNYESQNNQPGENEQSIEISLSNENQIENINENVNEDVNENDNGDVNENDNEDDEYIDNPNEYGVQNNDVDGNQLNEVSVINNSNLDNSNVSLNEDFENIIDKFNYDQEPANYEEAMKSRDRRNWQKAMSEELNDMFAN